MYMMPVPSLNVQYVPVTVTPLSQSSLLLHELPRATEEEHALNKEPSGFKLTAFSPGRSLPYLFAGVIRADFSALAQNCSLHHRKHCQKQQGSFLKSLPQALEQSWRPQKYPEAQKAEDPSRHVEKMAQAQN